jgi:exodeoxyribonuclease VII large subunit
VVTSESGAALQDILAVLTRRAPWASVLISPAQVQGVDAPFSIRKALERIAAMPEVEVVLLGRGGGAAEDLSAFNDEGLVRTVAAHPVPVISAVGHEVDVTLCDFAADVRAPTPSAAAELAVREAGHWLDRLKALENGVDRSFAARMERWRGRLDRLSLARRSPVRQVAERRLRVDRLAEGARAALERRLGMAASRLAGCEGRLARQSPVKRLADSAARLSALEAKLGGVVTGKLSLAGRRLEVAAGGLEKLSPLGVLARGYAVVRTDRGRILKDSRETEAGRAVRVTLWRGDLECRVEESHWAPDPPPSKGE